MKYLAYIGGLVTIIVLVVLASMLEVAKYAPLKTLQSNAVHIETEMELPSLASIPIEEPERFFAFEKKLPNIYIEPSITLAFGGDVMLSRYVDILMSRHHNYAAPFENIASFFRSADIAFVNLESPIAPTYRTIREGLIFGADVRSIEGLLLAGIDIVSLANNHIGDARQEGVTHTMHSLAEKNIQQVGAGRTIDEATSPTIITVRGTRFGFLAYADIAKYYAATEQKAGYAPIPDIEKLKKNIYTLKESADIVIVSFHTGIEYKKQPTEKFKNEARAAIDAGASLVIGHHPHVIQPVEQYKDGIIFYSLGNLVFDQLLPETKKGLTVKVTFVGNEITGIDLEPVIIEKLWKPRFATVEEKKEILQQMSYPQL